MDQKEIPNPLQTTDSDAMASDFARYRKQTVYAHWGVPQQRQFSQATVLIVGCGALGSAQANLLTRAGVGRLILADRDFVDLSNLQRQTLFEEADVADHLPKAIAAATRLHRINSEVQIEPIVADITWKNIESLVAQADLVLDGTDNFETRFLVNDACCKVGKPWVYGGCLGGEGQTMTILPGRSACFACLMPEGPPRAGSLPTCDTGGVLGSIIQIIASLQVNEAMKILSGQLDSVSRSLTVVDSWNLKLRSLGLDKLAQQGCSVCRGRQYPWLGGRGATQAHVLCGRNSVQLQVSLDSAWDLQALERQLATQGTVLRNPYLLKFSNETISFTLFPDGRVIATGTEDPGVAKAWLSQTIGL